MAKSSIKQLQLLKVIIIIKSLIVPKYSHSERTKRLLIQRSNWSRKVKLALIFVMFTDLFSGPSASATTTSQSFSKQILVENSCESWLKYFKTKSADPKKCKSIVDVLQAWHNVLIRLHFSFSHNVM